MPAQVAVTSRISEEVLARLPPVEGSATADWTLGSPAGAGHHREVGGRTKVLPYTLGIEGWVEP